MQPNSIGVVTVTRGRKDLLRRALDSVYAQDFDGEIQHIVVLDDDPESMSVLDAARCRPGLQVVGHLAPRPPAEVDEVPGDRRRVYPRLSRLFNTGVRLCSTTWISFLDDDNEFEPNHLSSLVACARDTGGVAIHSGRRMFWSDGSPYLAEYWHTVGNTAEGARIYELMCEQGVRIRGTNIVLDRADPVSPRSAFRPSSVVRADDPVFLVDQSVWLIRRDVALQNPIPEEFTEEDHQSNTAPDDKLLRALLTNGVTPVATGLPTVRYYLGGISNRARHDA